MRWSGHFVEEKNICQYKDSNPGPFSGWNSLYTILPINKGLDGPKSWSGQFGKQKILSPYKVWNTSCLVGGVVSGLVGQLVLLVVGWLVGGWVGGLVSSWVG